MKPQERTRRILKSGIEPSQRLILIAIADHMEDTAEGEDRNSRPSVALLCEETGLAERSVQGHLKDLETQGLLSRHQLPGHRTPHYQIHWAALAATLPPQNLHPAESAPRRICTPTPAESAPLPPQNLHPRQTTQGTIKGTTPLSLPSLPPEQLPSKPEREQNLPVQNQGKEQEDSEPLSLYQLFGPDVGAALTRAGITDIPGLTKLTARQTRMLKGIGEGNAGAIRLRLQAMGLDFAEEGRVAATGATDTDGPAGVKKRDFNPQPPRKAYDKPGKPSIAAGS